MTHARARACAYTCAFCRQDPYRHSPFDTAVWIMQTGKASRRWPADDDFEVVCSPALEVVLLNTSIETLHSQHTEHSKHARAKHADAKQPRQTCCAQSRLHCGRRLQAAYRRLLQCKDSSSRLKLLYPSR